MRFFLRALIAASLSFGLLAATAQLGHASGIVDSIVKAPITPNGDVAGEPTDIVLNLDISFDPSVDGRTLLPGGTIKVTLPEDFDNLGLPVASVGVCVPSQFNCSTGVLLQGWPQDPIPPPMYTVSLEGTHTIVYTNTSGMPLGPGTFFGPGIKQMHVILNGFRNPSPGRYTIRVEAETGPGGALEMGMARVHILPKARPSVNVTSVFADGDPACRTPTRSTRKPLQGK